MIKNEFIESLFLNKVQLDTYVKEITEQFKKTTFKEFDVKTVSDWVRSFFFDQVNSLEALLTEAFVLGQIFGDSKGEKNIKELPSAKEAIINNSYEKAIEYAKTSLEVNLSNAVDETNIATRNIIFQELSQNHGWRVIQDRLRESIKEGGDIQRYWELVS